MFSPSVAIPTLVGSLCSAVATSCVLVCYVIYADQQRSFRHALILNLAVAGIVYHSYHMHIRLTTAIEFINSVNNSISGSYVVANRRDITNGVACNVNGWVGQWSVQVSNENSDTHPLEPFANHAPRRPTSPS